MASPTTRANNIWEVNGGDDVLQIQGQGGTTVGGISSIGAPFGNLGSGNGSGFSGCTSNCSYVLTTADQQWVQPSAANALASANTIQAIKFFNNATRGLGNACFRLGNTASAGGHIDVGVYDMNGNLVWHMGAQSTTVANANLCASPTPATLQANTSYYIAWTADNNVANIVGAANVITLWGAVNLAGAPAHTFGINSTDVSVSGVLPSTMTPTNIVNSSSVAIPYVQVFL